jgi:hypothetical protein
MANIGGSGRQDHEDGLALKDLSRISYNRVPSSTGTPRDQSSRRNLIAEDIVARAQAPSRGQFTGWKVGASAAACVGLITLIINLAALGWLLRHPNQDGSLVEVYRGNCDQVERLQIWAHFAIVSMSVGNFPEMTDKYLRRIFSVHYY